MPRTCSICQSEQKAAIDKALLSGQSCREISALFRVSEDALQRHKSDHISPALARAEDAKAVAHGDDLLEELRRIVERVSLLSDACDRWLRDPDDPTRYDVGPRAHDVMVTYEQEVGDGDHPRTIRKKAPLSELLARIEGRYSTVAIETRHADPRDLLLKAYARLQGRLELVAKLLGEIDDRPQVNIIVSPEWQQLRTVIVAALEPYPEARMNVAQVLREIEAGRER